MRLVSVVVPLKDERENVRPLFERYVVPFEITSVLFLSAMVGAVVIGKKDKAGN